MFENATFHAYKSGNVGGWAGYYENADGECVGFETVDGKQVAWDGATVTVL